MATAEMANPVTDDSRPVIALLSMSKESFWDESYSDLVDMIAAKATIKVLLNVQEAGRCIVLNPPSAIIATDESITRKKPILSRRLVEYVQNGGTLILATHFPCFVRYPDLDKWFQDAWNLPWEVGSYTRSTVYLNRQRAQSRLTDDNLPEPYCLKALFLKNVSHDAMVFIHEDRVQSPIVFASIGRGYLGFIGDVNPDLHSCKALIAMCGLNNVCDRPVGRFSPKETESVETSPSRQHFTF